MTDVWSDEELDNAMAALYVDTAVNQDAQVRARAKLMRAAETRRAIPLAAVAASVVVVTAGALLVVATSPSSPSDEIATAQSSAVPTRPPATSGSQHAPMPAMPDQPQNSLNTLATRVSETPLGPGQYRYVSTQTLRRTTDEGKSGRKYTYMAEYRTETWIPADQNQMWMARNQTTQNRQWITGSEQEARADDVRFDLPLVTPDGETQARCGDFMHTEGCALVGAVRTFDGPVKPPHDPRQLYSFLADDSAKHSDPPLQFFRTASRLLDVQFSVAVRRATLQALSHNPYLRVADTTTRDNRTAVSIGIEYGGGRLLEEVLLDPANGQVIGARTVALKDVDGAKAGEQISDRVEHTAVADKLGVQPSR
ncbi:hypothetical protein KIPE111705_28000 [Kibdelosporangium persicum]|uniref:RNA polymerase sigma (70) factor n=1 Tax=Kibdelosporangium persicum TaxID=2698649 RepID=A0ABX2FGQ6_9PSEU|nr:hypothetical protein [Kibdelosporangium persicum]NRN70304.1 putative RNA polymerase sigma (70) factor [Kibdelosporangium persicum]